MSKTSNTPDLPDTKSESNNSLNAALKLKLTKRIESNNYRQLKNFPDLIDFSSNDYLGFARSTQLAELIKDYADIHANLLHPGAGASRLISGNHPLYDICENKLTSFYKTEKALIFNSGYDANLGLFSSLCERNDVILYDEHVHASIRDGIRLGHSRSFSFRHNDVDHLKEKLAYAGKTGGNVVVAIESVYSMEGVEKNRDGKYVFEEIIEYCYDHGAFVIVDEAHATGVYGKKGEGLVVELNLQEKVFARVHTFGKGLGVHGAAVVGSATLYDYLVNFARSFIYTTALPPHSLLSILAAHDFLQSSDTTRLTLKENIRYFIDRFYRINTFPVNDSAIHALVVPGNENARTMARLCLDAGFDVRAILSPTVPAGKETLRICLHSFNTTGEIDRLVSILQSR